MNLTAITEYEKVQTLHFLDSLTVRRFGDRQKASRIPEWLTSARARGTGNPAEDHFPPDTINVNGFDEQENHFSKSPEAEAGIERHRVISGRAEELAVSNTARVTTWWCTGVSHNANAGGTDDSIL